MQGKTLALPDTELVASIQRGETTAESLLYERYSARVYYLALGELRSPPDAEDVRAETFLRVIQAIRQGRLRSPEALASFIFGTAHHIVQEMIRLQQRAEQVAEEHVGELERHSTRHTVLEPNVTRAIEKTISRLKPREREFLRLYYYEELSKEQIAVRLGIKEERVRLIKSRALQHFRDVYRRLTKKVDTK